MKKVIFTADDFGLTPEVNAAVAQAHRDGVLTAASLMIAAPAADEAIGIARMLPTLGVGLHVVVADALPLLPPAEIPALVNSNGRLPSDLVGVGVKCFFAPAARTQLRREIEAQFAAFHATGLTCDHINAHNHMHLHPTVLGIILDCAHTYGIKHIRLPYEPARLAGAGGARRAIAAVLVPWLAMMRWRFRRAGLTSNDCLAGLTATGHMNESRVLAALEAVSEGATEFYFHPALGVTEALKAEAADYDRLGELDALTSPAVARRIRELGLVPCVFRDLI